jgi:hypothetical protein
MLPCDRGRARVSPSSSTSSQARTAWAKPSGSSPARRSIQDRIAGVVSSSSRPSAASTSATRGLEACRGVRARISVSETRSPAARPSRTTARPSGTSLIVERCQPWASPSCRAQAAAARSTGLPAPSAGCCHRGGGAAPSLRRQYEASALQLLVQ